MPTVSVIIPCYNHGHYLPCAVKSVLTQTFSDWEAIIVDDGSTDHTRQVAAQFTDPRVRTIYQENRGLSAARNTGIRAAQGKYLAFLDADDEWEPEFLEVCLTEIGRKEHVAAVYTRCVFIDPSGERLPSIGGRCVGEQGFWTENLKGGFFPVHAALVRAQVVREVGLFDETLTSEEDWDLWIRISQRYPIGCLPAPLARYRVYQGSMSTNAHRMHVNAIAVLTKHFGTPDGDPNRWNADKRLAYAYAYRSAAFRFIQQGEADLGWRYLAQAANVSPQILAELDTYYELVCGAQLLGYRGRAELLDIPRNGAEMLRRLDALFAVAAQPVQAFRDIAYGNAYLALAMLSDQAGRWSDARGCLYRAIRYHPAFLRDMSVVRRLVKLHIGRSTVHRLKTVLGRDKRKLESAS